MKITDEVYPHRAISILNHELPGEGNDEGENAALLALYALLAITKGRQTSMKDVHDAWALWTVLIRKKLDHPNLVPYEELSMDDAEKDRPYFAAILDTHFRLQGEPFRAPRYFDRRWKELS